MQNADGQFELAVALLVNDPDRITGISSYTFSLMRALEAAHDGPLRLITTWSPAGVASANLTRTECVHIPVGKSRMFTPIGYTLRANRSLDLHVRTVLLSPYPMGNFVSRVPQITVFHDLYRRIPGRYPWHQRMFFEAYARAVVGASAAVVAVSHTTADEVRKWSPAAGRKQTVVGEGSQFAPDRAHDPDRTNLLFVANVEANKNVSCLLDALRLLEDAGEAPEVRWIGRDRSGEIERWLAANGPLRSLVPLGVLDQPTLEKEYRNAGALVVTSTAEGFCLPVIEAQGFGVPTILSDIPVLREVGGDAALHFDPAQPTELANVIRKFQADKHLREHLSQASSINAARYSWDLAAAEIVRLAHRLA